MTGFLVALLILSPEGLGAPSAPCSPMRSSWAINLFFGSILAIISLPVTTVTLIAIFTGNQLTFGLSLPKTVVMLTALIVCQVSLSTGQTNVLNGAAQLALFVAYLMTIML